jgi:polyvinyl alcohol dehydrogenase (cytochrome)
MRQAASLLAAALLAACSGDPSGGDSTRIASTDELTARTGPTIDPATHPGGPLFQTNCASCHDGTVPKAPAIVWLEMMAPDAVLASMEDGIMREQAAHLSAAERRQIAEYLARTPSDAWRPAAEPPMCGPERARFDLADPPAHVLWGHDNRRFVAADTGGLTAEDLPRLRLKWAFAYPAAQRARSQPAIGWGGIFVGSQDGTVYALDLETGCVRWKTRVSAEVRTGIVLDPETRRAYFGDVLARAYAVDALTGRILWQEKVSDHPNATITGTPTLGGGQLFVPISSLEVTSAADPAYACCTFRGQVVALDPANGRERWRTFTVQEEPRERGRTSVGTRILGPSGAPVWNSPTFDPQRNRIYFGSGQNYSSPADGNSNAVHAVDARTGRRLWVTQFTPGDAWNVGCMMGNPNCPEEEGPDLDVAASPILLGDMLLVGQKSGEAFGLDPETGAIRWKQRLGHGGTQGGVHFGMATDGTRLFVPINDMADTRDARVYDARQRGAGVHAVDPRTGRILWRQRADDVCRGRQYCDPGVSAAATAVPGAVIVGHLDGRLRAHAAESGRLIWEADTTQAVKTISGETASGGSLSGPGPAVARGHLVANSGYGLYYHMPGNLLMVFSPEGR